MKAIDSEGLDTLFRTARTRYEWKDEHLPESTLRELYDLVKFGPTSANTSPARFVFVTTPEGKAKLAPTLSATNQRALAAPCVVIVAYDMAFTDAMPRLFPINPAAQNWFDAPGVRETTAMRNGSLQGGYLILAARALGLDTAAMSGFVNAEVDAAFFAGTSWKSNFLCAVGHAEGEAKFPRLPRLTFEEAARIA